MISMIVTVDRDWGIGRENEMLAHIQPDLKYFRETTTGHPVVMGHKTYLSLPEKSRPLPNRENIILTTQDLDIENVQIVHDLDELFALIKEKYSDTEVFIIGGASVYKQLLPYADKLYLTHIFRKFDGVEAYFPLIGDEWRLDDLLLSEEIVTHKYPHIFATYTKPEEDSKED